MELLVIHALVMLRQCFDKLSMTKTSVVTLPVHRSEPKVEACRWVIRHNALILDD